MLWQNITGRMFDVIWSGTNNPPPSNVTVSGGRFGPCQSPADGTCVPRLVGNNIAVDGVTIFGMTTTNSAYHVDGMFIRGCNTCSVTRSKFYGNMITDIRIQNCCSLPPNQNITIENNWFDPSLSTPTGGPRWDAIDVDTDTPGLLIRNNSFAPNTGISFRPQTNALVVDNILTYSFQCFPGVTFAHNVATPFSPATASLKCGASDILANPLYVNGAAFDFHIQPGSPAINAGNPANCASIDIDGQPRSGTCDAGSDQH
jgi:hypothetical protein